MYHSMYFTKSPYPFLHSRTVRAAAGYDGFSDTQKSNFDIVNTWNDWHLIPTKRPVFVPPSKKLTLIDIPGGNGVIDLSEALTGYPVYNNREGTFEFYMANDYGDWAARRAEIATYFHYHPTVYCFLEDDMGYYYEGTMYVSEWPSEANWGRIVFTYNVKPYKLSPINGGDNWLWDPFNFETGVILSNYFYTDPSRSNWKIVLSNSSETITFGGSVMPSTPVLTISVASGNTVTAEVTIGTTTTSLSFTSSGTYRFPSALVYGDVATLVLSGTGTVKIGYQGGSL